MRVSDFPQIQIIQWNKLIYCVPNLVWLKSTSVQITSQMFLLSGLGNLEVSDLHNILHYCHLRSATVLT